MHNTFVKSHIDVLKRYYDKVYVVATVPYFPRVMGKLSFFTQKVRRSLIVRDYSYDNVDVRYLTHFHLPVKYWRRFEEKTLHRKFYHKFKDIIDKSSLIYAHFTAPSGIFAHKIKTMLNKPYALVIHENTEWFKSEVEDRNPLFESAWQNASVIFRVNRYDADLLAHYNQNVVVIPNGFDHHVFKPLDQLKCKSELGYTPADKIIISVGFFKPEKAQADLIEAVYLMKKNAHANAKCVIIGGGALENKLKRLIQKYKLTGDLKLVDQIPQNELAKWYNAADIFSLSSISEGNPTVMFEAMACGLPYVGTDVGGIQDIVSDEKYGLLCEPSNPCALAHILEDGLNRKWDRSAIHTYSSRYKWVSIMDDVRQELLKIQ
jgi:glycosyltransferase involved in cell wall biosynthesis